MNEKWMKAGASGLPHYIKLFGSNLLTTACATTLARDSALSVETAKHGLAGAPGKHILVPVDPNYCQDCHQKAIQQA
jgi:hypothetical protein